MSHLAFFFFFVSGEWFDEPEVAGICLSTRTRDDNISVWIRDATRNETRLHIGEKLKEILNLDVNIQYIVRHILSYSYHMHLCLTTESCTALVHRPVDGPHQSPSVSASVFGLRMMAELRLPFCFPFPSVLFPLLYLMVRMFRNRPKLNIKVSKVHYRIYPRIGEQNHMCMQQVRKNRNNARTPHFPVRSSFVTI